MGYNQPLSLIHIWSGAAILSARACLRSGVGKLSVHTPKANYTVMQMAVPEAVLQMDASELRFTEALDTIASSAMGVRGV